MSYVLRGSVQTLLLKERDLTKRESIGVPNKRVEEVQKRIDSGRVPPNATGTVTFKVVGWEKT